MNGEQIRSLFHRQPAKIEEGQTRVGLLKDDEVIAGMNATRYRERASRGSWTETLAFFNRYLKT